MGSQEMAVLVGDGHITTKAQMQKVLRLYIRENNGTMSRKYLDNKKNGIVGSKFYRDKWGYDKLSAEVQWVGLNTQLNILAEYFLRYLNDHSLEATKRHFVKLWDEKTPKGWKEVGYHQKLLLSRFNEGTEGALNLPR